MTEGMIFNPFSLLLYVMMLKFMKIQGASTYGNMFHWKIICCFIKQHNGIKHEYMIYFCNCMQATYLLLPFVTKIC